MLEAWPRLKDPSTMRVGKDALGSAMRNGDRETHRIPNASRDAEDADSWVAKMFSTHRRLGGKIVTVISSYMRLLYVVYYWRLHRN
jgi:hypothetical protein